MIVAKDLTRRFGRILAVDSVNLQLASNQAVGVLGPNGAGKTTTIRMLTGYLPPTRGTVHICGFNAHRQRRAVRRRIGYLPEATPLYTEMRVEEFLRLRAKLFDIPRADRARKVDRAVKRCWLADVRRRPIDQLSKGYRQRVGLAAAILHEPPVLILDEPTVGLDPTQIQEVRGLIRELATSHLVLLSTHILSEVEQVCDRAVIIAGGKVQANGTIDELRQRAAGTVQYTVEVNRPDVVGSIRRLGGVQDLQTVSVESGWTRLEITSANQNQDLRETIMEAARDGGADVRELHRALPTLEFVFAKLTGQRGQPPESMPLPRKEAAA